MSASTKMGGAAVSTPSHMEGVACTRGVLQATPSYLCEDDLQTQNVEESF